jgi:hypothetical protein
MEQDPSTELHRPSPAPIQPPPLPARQPPATPPPLKASQAAGQATRTGPPRRPYPKPPSLLRLIGLLCIRPDQWAQAARYPMFVTIFPLALTILLTSIALAVTASGEALTYLHKQARLYDANYAPMVYANGTLSVQTPGKPLPHFDSGNDEIIIDPTIKSLPDASSDKLGTILLNDRGLTQRFGGVKWSRSYAELKDTPFYSSLFFPTDPFTINSAGLESYLNVRKSAITNLVALMVFMSSVVRNAAWALFVSLLVVPLVQIATRRLAIPFRVAWRIALAVTVPLIILDALLNVLGMPLIDTVGPEVTPLIWTGFAAGMAIWAGFLADSMYTPPRPVRRSRSL